MNLSIVNFYHFDDIENEGIYDYDNNRYGLTLIEDDFDKGYHEPEDKPINIEFLKAIMLDCMSHEECKYDDSAIFRQLFDSFVDEMDYLNEESTFVTLELALNAWQEHGQNIAKLSLVAVADNENYQDFLHTLMDLKTIVYSFHDANSKLWLNPQA